MKPEIHPDYHTVIFHDSATGKEWTTRSTLTSKETREVDGETVPVVRLEVSSLSHPFWTGQSHERDAEGRIDRFRKRWSRGGANRKKSPERTSDQAADKKTKKR